MSNVSDNHTNPKNVIAIYTEVENTGLGFWGIFSFFALLVLMGIGSFNYMHHHGHYVTGMNNQIVWGIPHVFAIFLIVAASGSANIATLGTVFGKKSYQSQGRFSLLIAASLLIGGLIVILLDLGSISHVIEMTKGALNFESVFAWNIILYSGFLAIIAVYLWTMMDRTKNAKSLYKPLGLINMFWRIILTTGTGSIFGVLLARQSYDLVMMIPLFLATSYLLGTAVYSMILLITFRLTNRELGNTIIQRLRQSLLIFIVIVLLIEFMRHLVNIFITDHPGEENLPLIAEQFTGLFWTGQMIIGSVLPIILLVGTWFKKNSLNLICSSILIVVGGFFQLYIIIIGGQSFPLVLFSDAEITSTFADGLSNVYSATLVEYLMGIGGIGFAVCMLMIGIKVLRILPSNLVDDT